MDKKEIFKSFINTHDVLIVDKNASSRSRLLKTVCDLGCKRNTVHTCGTMIEAEEIINTKRIGIVLSDYIIGGGSGFDLFKMVRAKNSPEQKDEIWAISSAGTVMRTPLAQTRETGRDTLGVRLVNLDPGISVVSVTRLVDDLD